MSQASRPPQSRPPHRTDPASPSTAAHGRKKRSTTPTGTSEPVPSTVWACGPEPVDPRQTWPVPIIEKIATSFSQEGDRVAVLPWAAAPSPRHSKRVDVDRDLLAALAAIDSLRRTSLAIHTSQHPPSRDTRYLSPISDGHVHDGLSSSGFSDVDLIVASFQPAQSHDVDHYRDTLCAARMLRSGGVLAVLTHSTRVHGELVDPTGPIVTAAQDADLLYLQHIVALHVPIHQGAFVKHSLIPDAIRRVTRRGSVPGLRPHVRIHSDVLVFAQPRTQQSPPLALAHAAVTKGAR